MLLDVQTLSQTPKGREILLNLIEDSGVFRYPSTDDPLKIAAEIGARRLGIQILQNMLTDGGYVLSLAFRERHERFEMKNKGRTER